VKPRTAPRRRGGPAAAAAAAAAAVSDRAAAAPSADTTPPHPSQAACCIVSHAANAHLDAYVLSESSLFVSERRLVLKTCGTTRLLAAVPAALAAASSVGLAPCRVKYSRASFLFPEEQPAPHHDFSAETATLRAAFPGLAGGAYVLGDALDGLQWHVYVADGAVEGAAAEAEAAAVAAADPLAFPTPLPRPPTYTLEVCMTGLDPARAAQFARGPAFVDAPAVSAASGIAALLAGAALDDYVFEPCGYSANAVVHGAPAFATIHVTPEAACSYASVELCGYAPDTLCPSAVVARVASIFGAERLSVAMSVDADVPFCPWLLSSLSFPAGYAFAGAAAQDFGGRGRTAFYCLAAEGVGGGAAVNASALAAPKRGAAGSPASPSSPLSSPGGPLRLSPSLFSAGSSLAAALGSGGSSDGEGGGAPSPPAPVRTPSPGGFPASSLLPPRPPSPALPLLPGGGAAAALASLLDGRSPAAAAAAAAPRARRRPPAPAPLGAVLAAARAIKVPDGSAASIDAAAAAAIDAAELEDTLYVVDLASAHRAHAAWAASLPRVDPFYAVKCNPDPALVATLASAGAGFDCASAAEIDLVLSLGVPPHRIIFANACKRPSDLRAAAAAGVELTTFDAAGELLKIADHHPRARALLRLRADDAGARCQLGNKYGADPEAAPALLAAAAAAGVAVVGVSFHVGSGATDPASFATAIALARTAFDVGASLGFSMDLLDIGGGFAAPARRSDGGLDLGPAPAAVNAALAAHFPPCCGVRVIAEPGRYYAEGAATLFAAVFGARDAAAPCGAPARDYWITDGLYGSMNCVLYDHATLAVRVLDGAGGGGKGGERERAVAAALEAAAAGDASSPPPPCHRGCCAHIPPGELRSTLFGPTCDGLDTVLRDHPLPRLAPGAWLAFPRMGAYTVAGASAFNGFDATAPAVTYVWSETG